MKAVKLRVTVNIEGGRGWDGELVADERQCVALYNGVANYFVALAQQVVAGRGIMAIDPFMNQSQSGIDSRLFEIATPCSGGSDE